MMKVTLVVAPRLIFKVIPVIWYMVIMRGLVVEATG